MVVKVPLFVRHYLYLIWSNVPRFWLIDRFSHLCGSFILNKCDNFTHYHPSFPPPPDQCQTQYLSCLVGFKHLLPKWFKYRSCAVCSLDKYFYFIYYFSHQAYLVVQIFELFYLKCYILTFYWAGQEISMLSVYFSPLNTFLINLKMAKIVHKDF